MSSLYPADRVVSSTSSGHFLRLRLQLRDTCNLLQTRFHGVSLVSVYEPIQSLGGMLQAFVKSDSKKDGDDYS